ncbi:MAG: transglycosylase domain-containing protein [Prevotellaceae bacterium]|nr:transglycosylase domain-containing protein [Prevotellaceae bacterium]
MKVVFLSIEWGLLCSCMMMSVLKRITRWLCFAAKSLCLLPLSLWRWYSGLYRGKSWYKRVLTAAVSLVLLLFFYVFAVYVNLLWLFGKMPSVDSIMHPETDEASVVYSADGVVLGKFFRENRSSVRYDDVAPMFFRALIDTEDERFYYHNGIDYQGVAAAVKDMFMGSPRGASTITQQLAKNMFRVRTQYSNGLLGNVPGVKMLLLKTKECIAALELEMLYSKEEILQMYINTVDFGSNAYGLRTAAATYFGTTPDRLKIEECAVLVGLLKATSTYNPHSNYDKSLMRRNVVLYNLFTHGDLSRQDYDSLSALPIDISKYKVEKVYDGSAPYLRQEIARFLNEKFKEQGLGSVDLYSDGLRIYTTIDSRMQHYAESAVLTHVSRLQRNFRLPASVAERHINSVLRTLPRYRQVKDNPDSLDHYLNVEANQPHEVLINDPYTGPQTMMLSTRDSIRTMLSFLQAGFVVVEPSTHHIKAWVGNLNFRTWNHDNVIARHQMGSTFKGIVYTEAMEQGWSPCDYIADAPPPGTKLKKSRWSGGDILLRSAFKFSKNAAAINLCYKVGPNSVVRLARKLGISDKLYNDCQNLTLGSSSVKLVELVNAYSVMLADGYVRRPIIVTKVVDRYGKVVYSEDSELMRKVLSTRTAFLMQQMLRSGLEGTSAAMYGYIRNFTATTDFGGKTGTTNESSDALYLGVIPNLVGGVWVGGEYRDIHPNGSGSSLALPVWGRFIQQVLSDTRFTRYKQKFPQINDKVVPRSCYQCGYGTNSLEEDDATEENEVEQESPEP